MRTTISSIFLAVFCSLLLTPSYAALQEMPKESHHVMWTNKKGKAKCANKGSKEKAEKCAAKLRAKPLSGVQVMAGKCSSM